MKTNTIEIFKQLYAINKKGDRRSSGRDVKILSKVIQYLFFGLTFLLFVFFAIMLIKNSQGDSFDIYPILSICCIAVVPFLLYEFFIRLSLPTFINDELPALFILPLAKNKVVLYKILYTLIDGFTIAFIALASPIYGAIAYIYLGLWGFFYALITTTILLLLNKQISILFKSSFFKNKIISLLGVIGYYASLFAIGAWSFYQYNEYNHLSVWINSLFPSNGLYGILFLFLFTGMLVLTARINYKKMIAFKLDETGENDNEYKSSFFSRTKLFDKYGKLGKQIQIDLLFILRTKKLKPLIYVFPLISIFIIYITVRKDKGPDIFSYNIFWFYYTMIMAFISTLPYDAYFFNFYATKREHFNTLLKSKYITINAITFISTLITLPIVYLYDISLHSLFAVYMFSPGLISLLMMQLYVHQKIAINPDAKGRVNKNFNGVIFIVIIFASIAPLIPIVLSKLIFDSTKIVYTILITLNLIIVLLSPLWIKNIAKRMNKRKYTNLESLQNSTK